MRKWCALMTVVLCALWAIPAFGQYSQDYDALAGDADGEDLNGQAGYYLPPAGGVTATVHTYAGNTLGFPANPTGGDKFVGARGPGPVFVRSQVDFAYPSGVVKFAVDTAANFEGPLPRAQNIGSCSVQLFPGQKGGHIQLATFTDPNTATTWDADYVWFNAANTQLQEKIPNFQGLALNHWYRRWTTIDLATNVIVEVGLKDLTSGAVFTFSPPAPPDPLARYGWGGSAGGPDPTGGRLFGGTSIPGNTMAFDNFTVAAVVAENTCQYTLSKVKAKRCGDCPSSGDAYDTGVACNPPDCAKKLKKTIECPSNPDGICKLKAKGASCQ